MTRWQAFHGRVFRRLVAAVRSLRPHRWPVVGKPIATIAESLMSRTHPTIVWAEGHQFHLDRRDDLGLARGRPYEPLLRQAMETHIRAGAVVVDGGAHIGYHTLLAARLVGQSGRVIAFEPAPATYALLAENVALNDYQNVTLVNAALSDHAGRAVLHLSADTTGDHRIDEVADRETVEVNLESLDSFLDPRQRVDFIKLDVQGAEPLVLRGAARIIDANPQLVAAVEYDPSKFPRSIAPESFLAELFARFATVYDVNDEARIVRPASILDLLRTYTPENERHTNLLCFRASGN